jgi:hypothetical protein
VQTGAEVISFYELRVCLVNTISAQSTVPSAAGDSKDGQEQRHHHRSAL